jgi:NADPH:quinone reductase-like Zn-dependent oxidoreductase
VVAFTSTGGYADRVCVPAERLVAAPAGLDFASLAALPTNYVTALQLLEREAHARAGETVVIHVAGGGVGTALLQVARVLGLRAIGTERAAKLELVRELGAAVVDCQREDVAARVRELCPAGPDIVLDPIGGEHAARSYALLHAGGRLVVDGFAGGDSPEAIAALRSRLQAWNALPGGARTSLYSLRGERRLEFARARIHRAGGLHRPLARDRQLDTAWNLHHQRDPCSLLQRRKPPSDRRLIDLQPPRRARDIAALAQHEQMSQVVPIQGGLRKRMTYISLQPQYDGCLVCGRK